jgi:hypothetical protein
MDLFPPCGSTADEEGGDYSDQPNYEYNELVPDAQEKYAFDVFRDSWGFRDKRVISSASLNLESEVIVADTVNGIPLTGENPFCFVAKARRGGFVVIKKVANIKLNTTRWPTARHSANDR